MKFDAEYWLGRCSILYVSFIGCGYSEADALDTVEHMLHMFDDKYGRVVIDDFLDFFKKEFVHYERFKI